MAEHQQPNPNKSFNPSKKKKALGPVEWITLIIIILIVGFIILNQMGVKMVETSETVELNNRPGPKHQDWDDFKKKKDKLLNEKKVQDKISGDMLHQFVEDYRVTGNRDLKEADIKFLKKMDEKVQKEGNAFKDAKDYYDFMQRSFKFYNAIKDFGEMTPKGTKVVYPQDQKEVDNLINKIFTVEQEKLEIFTDKNPSTEEWIEFINHDSAK